MTLTTGSLVAITPGGDITDDMLAGAYLFYSIPEDMLSLRSVRKAFVDNGLDESLLPSERRPEHVMQEACRTVEGVKTNGHREEVRAEQVLRTSQALVYQITKHVQDKQNRVIEHPKALRVIYDFNQAALVFEPLDGAKMSDVQEMVDKIQAHFDGNATKIPGHKLRTILRHYIEAAGAENMRGGSGGVYFLAKFNQVPTWSKIWAHHQDGIDGFAFIAQIQAMLEQLYGTAPNFHSIPCINDEGQREFLKRRFIENCLDDLKAYRDECLELVNGKEERKRAFRSDKRTSMISRRKEIDLRRQKFAEILGETLDELNRDMSLADKALSKFIAEADA